MRLVCEEVGKLNRRYSVALDDGARVEAVLYRGDTLCVSSQVGCAVSCPFCASGAAGLGRNLRLDELTGQVEAVVAEGRSVTRVTVSGVGEPLHNHDAVSAFVAWCRQRRIGPSVTTSGGPLRRLSEWLHLPHNGLTLSVHAGTEPVRRRMVPRGPSLDALFTLLADEVSSLSRSRRRKIALGYLVLAGVNEHDAEVDAFVARAAPLGLPVHLYAYNPVATSTHRGVGRDRYEAIFGRMTAAGLVVRMSSRARLEANGGCGTLVAAHAGRARVLLIPE